MAWIRAFGTPVESNFLFKDGEVYSSKTGGWSNAGWKWNSSTSLGDASIISDHINIAVSTGIGTQIKVDLTNVRYIRVKANVIQGSAVDSCVLTINSTDKYYYSGGTPVIFNNIFTYTGLNDFYIDVSSYSGSYFIGMASAGVGRSMDVYEVELVP